MNNFFQILLRLLALGALSFVFFLAIILLQPAKTHRKRKISTPFLKTTYLFYLAVFLVFLYFLLFTSRNIEIYFDELNYTLTVLAALLPTVAVMIRRKIHKIRSFYNYFIGVFNLIVVLWLIHFFFRVFIF